MAIKFSCGSCGKKFVAKDEHAGRASKCPACGWPIAVPKAVEPVWEAMPDPEPTPPPVPDQPVPCPAEAAPGTANRRLAVPILIAALAGAGFTLAVAGGALAMWLVMTDPKPQVRSVVTARAEPKANVPRVVEQPKPPPDYTRWKLDKVFRWDTPHLECVAFSPDGRTVAVGGGSEVPTPNTSDEPIETGLVQMWDVFTREAKGHITDPADKVRSLAFYPKGEAIVVACFHKTRVIDAKTGFERFVVRDGGALGVAVNAKRNLFVGCNGWGFWDMANGDNLECPVPSNIGYPAFSPDGRLFYCSSELWSLETGKKVGRVCGGWTTFSHDSRFLTNGDSL
jgi:hypothetical protein